MQWFGLVSGKTCEKFVRLLVSQNLDTNTNQNVAPEISFWHRGHQTRKKGGKKCLSKSDDLLVCVDKLKACINPHTSGKSF